MRLIVQRVLVPCLVLLALGQFTFLVVEWTFPGREVVLGVTVSWLIAAPMHLLGGILLLVIVVALWWAASEYFFAGDRRPEPVFLRHMEARTGIVRAVRRPLPVVLIGLNGLLYVVTLVSGLVMWLRA